MANFGRRWMMCKAAIDRLAKSWFQTKKMILWLFHMACLICCLFAVVEIAQCLTFLRILTSPPLNFVLSLFPMFVNESLSISIYFLSHNATWVFWRLTTYANFHLCYTIFPSYLFFSPPYQCHHHQKSISKNNLLSPNLVATISSFWDSLPKELGSSSSTYFLDDFFLFR